MLDVAGSKFYQLPPDKENTGSAECILKGTTGYYQMVINDPAAQQPSQMFFIWVKARPQHQELHALLFMNSVWVL